MDMCVHMRIEMYIGDTDDSAVEWTKLSPNSATDGGKPQPTASYLSFCGLHLSCFLHIRVFLCGYGALQLPSASPSVVPTRQPSQRMLGSLPQPDDHARRKPTSPFPTFTPTEFPSMNVPQP